MQRILVINDYSLRFGWDNVRRRRSPAHLLYGVDSLEAAGFELEIVSDTKTSWLAALDRRLGRWQELTGSFDRQTAAAPFVRNADLIYAPCQTQTQFLAYLRAANVLRTPLICLAHHPLVRGRFGAAIRPLTRLMLRGLTAMPALSESVAAEVNALAPGRALSEPLRLGPDAHFYPSAEYPGQGIIAAGRTGRDFVTFGRAATLAHVRSTILCQPRTIRPEFGTFGPEVRVMAPEVFLEYMDSARLFASARALAIPMVAQDGLCGLSSLMDALGAGKPVIMTRNPGIDVDIEALGIGRWVEPGDLDGWVHALRFFDENPMEAAAMGQRARALVDGGYDYRAFSRELLRIVRTALAA